jgi:TonB family protein
MKYSRLAFWCVLCLAIFATAGGCKPKPLYETVGEPRADPLTPTPTSPITQQSPSPSATPEGEHLNLTKLAESIRPAVILVTVFDPSGKLLRTGTGFFVSDSGRIITTWRTVEGAVNAVAKTADGGIYNISGVSASSTKLDLAILHAEAKKVPFLILSKTGKPDMSTRVAVIGSALAGNEGAPVEGTISPTESDETGDELELAARVPAISLGSPVVDPNGEVIGVVTARNEKNEGSSVVRPASTVKSVVAQVGSTAAAHWPGEPRLTPSPKPRVVYRPNPIYPSEARFHDSIARSGRYRLNFDVNGTVKNVQVLQSTGSDVLDRAAINGLQQWKSEPGREGFITVPLTFQSR